MTRSITRIAAPVATLTIAFSTSVQALQSGSVQTWSVERTDPRIGGSPNDPRYQLFQVTGGDLLSDGRIVVANTGTQELRFFSSSGTATSVSGGNGEGPGELRTITSLEVGPGDSVYVFDARLQRLTVYGRDGSTARVTRIPVEVGLRVGTLGRFTGGRWFAAETSGPIPTGGRSMARDSAKVMILGANLQPLRQVGAVPGYITGSAEIMGQRGSRIVPFSPRPLYAHTESCLFTLSSDANTVSVFVAGGEPAGSIRLTARGRTITASDVANWVAATATDVPPEALPTIQATLKDFPRPDNLPYYHEALTDDLGYLWLQEFVPPTGAGTEWVVIGQGRTPIAQVNFPEPVQLLRIRRNTVLALARTAVGEEVIQVYRLNRNVQAVSLCAGGR